MRDLVRLIVWMVVDLFLSRAALETEILTLRQQINVLRRTAPKKQPFSAIDRLIFVCLYRLLPNVRDALAIVKPETVVKWHRAGFRLYWRWKSKARGGRPTVPLEIRRLIREMSIANPRWGAPRIHGELLSLGIEIGQTSVAKYMVRRRHPPSQGWRTFIRNHADGIAAMDMLVVPERKYTRSKLRVPALILCQFLGKDERMRPGVVGRRKNRSAFVRIPVAIVDVKIEPASLGQEPTLGLLEFIKPRMEAPDMTPGCVLQRGGHEVCNRIDFVGEVPADLLMYTKENAMRRG